MKNPQLSLLVFCLLFVQVSFAQDVYHIWEGQEKPYYKENDLKEYEAEAYGTTCVYDITDPTITIYHAKGENTGKAVIICPGGGYSLEAANHEGYDVAEFLSQHGVTGVVLKYRLPNPKSSDQPHLVPITDARQALKLVRQKADQYGINTHQVGIMGFSAGSHLATTVSLWKSDVPEENANFSGLIYGVTDNKEENIKWIEESLYYRELNEKELEQNKLLDLVSKDTPPTFLVHAYDDDICHVSESALYAEKLFEHGVMAEMHLFPKGGHGFGMGRKVDGTDQWPLLFVNWLKTNDFSSIK